MAKGCPTLSHIHVKCDAKDPYMRTLFWLEKAQESPLHISLDVTNDVSRIPPIMAVLMMRATQWRTLSVTSTLLRHANHILSLCDHPIPQLIALSISVLEEFDDNIPQFHADNLDLRVPGIALHAPHLKTLHIDRNIISSPRTAPSQITILSINLPYFHTPTKLSVDSVILLLEALPSLQKLSMSLPYRQAREFEQAIDENHRVFLSDLVNLVLAGSPNMFRLVPYLTTPFLSSLHLRSTTSFGYVNVETSSNIRQHIETAMPPLELLDLHDIDLTPSDFATCFARLPNLKDLRLHESDIPDLIIEGLAQPYEQVCPMLDRLDLRWCSQMTGRALVGLIHNRRGSAHPIGQITS